MVTGAVLVAAERKRQIDVEGYTLYHDLYANYTITELVDAAFAYVHSDVYQWPWGLKHFKPTNELRNYIKAGALLQAAIDTGTATGRHSTVGTYNNYLQMVVKRIDAILEEARKVLADE